MPTNEEVLQDIKATVKQYNDGLIEAADAIVFIFSRAFDAPCVSEHAALHKSE